MEQNILAGLLSVLPGHSSVVAGAHLVLLLGWTKKRFSFCKLVPLNPVQHFWREDVHCSSCSLSMHLLCGPWEWSEGQRMEGQLCYWSSLLSEPWRKSLAAFRWTVRSLVKHFFFKPRGSYSSLSQEIPPQSDGESEEVVWIKEGPVLGYRLSEGGGVPGFLFSRSRTRREKFPSFLPLLSGPGSVGEIVVMSGSGALEGATEGI